MRALLCHFDHHHWRYFIGTDYGVVHVARVTVRKCTRRRCPLGGRVEVVSSKVAGLAGVREPSQT